MNRIKKRLPLLLAVSGSLIYISLIFNNNLWMDEAFTAVLVRGSFKEMLSRSLLDTLPVLYNVLAWTLTHILGYNSVVLKLASVLPMIALLFFSALKLPKLYDDKTASFFIPALFCMPHLLHYTVEIRMYSLCLSFTTIAGIYALQFFKDKDQKSCLLFSFFSALSAYSHHYGIITLAFLWIYLFIYLTVKDKKAYRAFFTGAFTTFLLCIPYVIVSVIQIKNSTSYFTTASDVTDGFFASLRYPFVTNVTVLSALLLLSAVLLCFTGRKMKEACALISVYIPVLLLSYGLMLLTKKPFFSARYLVPSLGLLWLGYAILLSYSEGLIIRKDNDPLIKRSLLHLIFLILMFAVFSVCYVQQFKEEYKPGVTSMLSFFDENLTEDDGYIIYEDNYQIEWCMRYYEPELKKYDPENIDKIKGRIWYFSVPGYENMLDEKVAEDYNIVYKGEMSFDKYSFELYELTDR